MDPRSSTPREAPVAAWLLRVLAVLWGSGVLAVGLGTFVPRVPVVGFLGSFVSGQYPVHAALAAAVGVGLGAATWAAGGRGTGGVVAGIALVGLVGTVVVLVAQARLARAEGVTLDWAATLTVVDQPDGHPDVTVPYTTVAGRDLQLDLYRPAGEGPHPVVVWVHGGSWVRGERDDRTALNRWLADRGYAVVAVEYRLPPPGPVGEGQRRDVACALGWVADRAGTYGLDPGRITLAGQSAGATLALSTTSGVLDGSLTCGGAAVPAPRAVVAYYPATDLRMIAPSLQDALFGAPAGSVPDQLRLASPTEQVRPGLPPTLVVLGSADHFVFADRVVEYDARLRAAGVGGRLVVVPYADHVFDHPFGSPGAQATRPVVARFLAEHGVGPSEVTAPDPSR